MRTIVAMLLAAGMLAAASVSACELCGGAAARRGSLAFEFDQAQVILYGRLANPKLNAKGNGTTEFHVDAILKDDPAFARQKVLIVPRYLPILDDKKPPQYVMFFRAGKGSQEPYWGKEIANPKVLKFMAELNRLRDDPAQRLVKASERFDDADPLIADEAFMVFAKANDKLVAQVAPKLNAGKLRKLVGNPDLEPERISLFAYLLGACGKDSDAALLVSILKNAAARDFKSFEGVLAGYISLRPKEGWDFTLDTLANPKQSFLLRYAAIRTMRFYYNAKPAETEKHVLLGMSLAIAHVDIADIAI
ncbi:MAG: hypothetical protein HYR84_08120, partial [Planctomycetes bacterium]|nr:hypothetical protein [Planctomycetota bacterium]